MATELETKSESQLPAPAALFSGKEEEVISRCIDVKNRVYKKHFKLEDFYEVKKCVGFITENKYEKVALQFPDELLEDSFSVSNLIAEETSKKVFILGDTSYGSCCIDEIAAEHIKADCIIHFGRACLSQTKRLPVLYVFGSHPIDKENCCNKFEELFPNKDTNIIVFYDVIYRHASDEIYQRLSLKYKNIIVSKLIEEDKSSNLCSNCKCSKQNQLGSNCCGGSNESKCNVEEDANKNKDYLNDESCSTCQCCESNRTESHLETGNSIYKRFGRSFTIQHHGTKLEDHQIFYIGSESLTLRNLIMSYNKNQFFTYDPETTIGRKETLNVNRTLMKRYYLIQKAKDAQVVGIIVGTLGVADYLLIIERIKKILKSSGKKYYTFVIGKLNIAKLANFMEIDIFVLVACPENSLIDSQEFYKPIVTPFEMEIACLRAREWTGEYITDFRELLPGASSHVDIDKETAETDEEPSYSLITGKLIQLTAKEDNDNPELSSSAILPRNQQTAIATFGSNSAAEFLVNRSWKGLEKNAENEVTKAVEGRRGISLGYTHEPKQETEIEHI